MVLYATFNNMSVVRFSGRRGRDHMIVGFTATYVISATTTHTL
jgi:hypothetical protein